MRAYDTYLFRDKDPVIDVLRTFVVDEARKRDVPLSTILRECAQMSRVTPGTLNGWFYGKTQRPMHCTLEAVARCFGLTFNELRQLPKKQLRVIRGGRH